MFLFDLAKSATNEISSKTNLLQKMQKINLELQNLQKKVCLIINQLQNLDNI